MSIAHRAYKAGFNLADRFGLHFVKNHFYSPTPDLRAIPADYWRRQSDMPGIDLDRAGQLRVLDRVKTFKSDYVTLPLSNSFGSVDVEMLYSLVRIFNPRKVIEIGSGHSSLIISKAKNPECELVCIEPYERPEGNGHRLIKKLVQSVPLDEFASLRKNDILFIDSSHVLKEASDVLYEYLEILPRLQNGVIVHIHDVFLPLPYPKAWVVDDLRFWNEQYLLQSFLAFNSAFHVLWAGNWMALNLPEQVASAFPSFRRGHMPGSFWMQKIQ